MNDSNFQRLKVWQKSKDLAVLIYKLCNAKEMLSKDYKLKNQLCASAVSVPSNISEGEELNTIKQSLRHLYIAKGSNAELKTQLIIANEIGYISDDELIDVVSKSNIISKMLYKLIKTREEKQN